MNRFPFRPFDDVKRPRTADEVKISYQMLVSPGDGINELEAKITALYALVREGKEIGYQLSSPRIIAETADQWKVAVPSHFSINQGKRGPEFEICVDKAKGKISCFGPAADHLN